MCHFAACRRTWCHGWPPGRYHLTGCYGEFDFLSWTGPPVGSLQLGRYTGDMFCAQLALFTSPRLQDQWLTIALWWLVVIWLATLGGCVGSFLTVVWDRRGTERGIVFPPSQCEECGHSIRWYHNIPIAGWLFLRGHCHDCGAPVPVKHLLVEVLFAGLFIVAGILSPWL